MANWLRLWVGMIMNGPIPAASWICVNISLSAAYSYENRPKETHPERLNYNTRVPKNHIWFAVRPFNFLFLRGIL